MVARKPLRTPNRSEYDVLLDLLRAAREQAGLSQHALSKALGEDAMYVHKVENKDRRLDVLEFVAMCRELKREPLDVMANWLSTIDEQSK